MKKLFAALLLSAMPILALPTSSWAQGASGDAAAGKKLWESNELFCKNCHGRDGEGAFGPDLAGRGPSPPQILKAVGQTPGGGPPLPHARLFDAPAPRPPPHFCLLPDRGQPPRPAP